MSEPSPWLRRFATATRPYLLLAFLGLLFFGRALVHPGEVLYSDRSDLLEETLPAKRFLLRNWHETGELPLWCPYSYAGMPFLHDVKVGLFYPPHWPLLLLTEEQVGGALTWLVVLHVIVAGWGMFAYARFRGLGPLGSLVAAAGFMFAGKWLLHLLSGGHYFMAPLAWLPLILLGLEAAIVRRSLAWATFGGAMLALPLLGGHPQVTFYSGVFVALWTLGAAMESAGILGGPGPRSRRRMGIALARWAGYGAWAVAVAVALSAVQLLPALEATGEATRGGGVPSGVTPAYALSVCLRLVGPSLTGAAWEGRGALGALWLATAALAPLLRGGRTRFELALLALLIIFAIGGGALAQPLPGFGLFQLHSRILLPGGLALAFMAGTTVDALCTTPLPRRARRIFLAGVACAVVIAAIGALMLPHEKDAGVAPGALAWWGIVLVGVVLLGLLSGRTSARPLVIVWAVVLVAELCVPSWPLVQVRPADEIYSPSLSVEFLRGHRWDTFAGNASPTRVLDRGLDEEPSMTPLTPGLAMIEGIESVRGYNSLDVQRFKEYLQMVAGRDDPVLPRTQPFGFPVLGYFPIQNWTLLDLLGVRYLLQPAAAPDPPDFDGLARDQAPEAYQVIAGGRRVLPPFALYENPGTFPRAFVVGQARPLPGRQDVLRDLRDTDFRRVVLLEGHPGGSADAAPSFRSAEIREYQPNRVAVRADGPGFLVLTDIAYPGWTASIDGQPVPIYRANYLFRAVELSAGNHDVLFRFDPASYRLGRIISMTALCLVLVLAGVLAARRLR
jgi:hypothetical protein